MRFAKPLFLLLGLCLSGLARAEFPEEFGPVEAKAVWVDFWASWCAPCRRSFPWMNAMHQKYADQGLRIIAVNVDADRQLAEEFLVETPAEFSLHFDPAGRLAEEFSVQAMPSSFILDPEGNVLATHYGFKLANAEDYERAIQEALAGTREAQSAPKE